MKLRLNNITHRDCPVHLREKSTLTSEQQQKILRQIHTKEEISEAVILQTCNRLEFYTYARKDFDVSSYLTEIIRKILPDAVEIWHKHSRQTNGIDVVRHLFEVAAGLDSQMIGENQILSQVKSAYKTSLDYRMSKFVFHRLFHNAFRVGKAVRTNTNINCGAVSISLAAVELAKKKVHLPAAKAMVIGAGENIQLAARYLLKSQLQSLIIANRNKQKAQYLASQLNTGKVIGLTEIPAGLAEVDLLIASTAASEPVVTYDSVKDTLANRDMPLLIIDIAVPRDIDPKIGHFECVSLCNIDDLNEQISLNKQKRRNEIPKARHIVTEFTDKFDNWLSSLNLVPLISQLTQKSIELAHNEAKRYEKDFSRNDSEKLKLFAESLAKKMMHGPISFLKNNGDEELSSEQLQAVDLINKMFFSKEKDV